MTSAAPREGWSLRHWDGDAEPPPSVARRAYVECGWGRILFGHTFEDAGGIVTELQKERPGCRDIVLYTPDPHVVLAAGPEQLFLDPSHTYRLDLRERRFENDVPWQLRPLQRREDAEAVESLYREHHMVPVTADFLWENRKDHAVTYFVAADQGSGEIVGSVLGIDHVRAFGDPEGGCSLWGLVVSSRCPTPGVGRFLVERLAHLFQKRGRAFMDLSVLHDNRPALALYESLGFRRIPAFAVKRRTPRNESLFTPAGVRERVNEYSRIFIDEALRRGVKVEVLHGRDDYFRLTLGGRTIVCRETLTSLTHAVAMSRCDDKAVTRQVLAEAGLRLPDQIVAGDDDACRRFLERHGRVVVKPRRGEQGAGISIDLREPGDVAAAIERARQVCAEVLLEELVEGEDLRIIVIGGRMIAAAVRRPPEIEGTGEHTIEALIQKLERRRNATTVGRIRIPLDDETRRCIAAAGYDPETVLPAGERLRIRRTANVHTGGTIDDVTPIVHPELGRAAERAAAALEIPVVGLDLLVPDLEGPDYVIIEANERPALVNHEPQPVAEHFVDLLFPQSRADAEHPGGGA